MCIDFRNTFGCSWRLASLIYLGPSFDAMITMEITYCGYGIIAFRMEEKKGTEIYWEPNPSI
jgi:hypothetical protein